MWLLSWLMVVGTYARHRCSVQTATPLRGAPIHCYPLHVQTGTWQGTGSMVDKTGSSGVALIVGASGGIGRAVVEHYLGSTLCAQVIAVSRSPQPQELACHGARLRWLVCDSSQAAIEQALGSMGDVSRQLSRIIICNGILHSETVAPEKSLFKLDEAAMQEVLHANTVVPALWVAALSRVLRGGVDCVIAVLSARVGSISDNRLGGWYSYRASKAALNNIAEAFAMETLGQGIRVNTVCPAETDTEMCSTANPPDADTSKWMQPDDIADVNLFLLSEQSRAMTGATLIAAGYNKLSRWG